MQKRSMKTATIDDFIAQYPQVVQKVLQEIRHTIRNAAPGAQEKISYGIPTFTQNGNLIHFSAYEKHIGIYPGAEAIVAFKAELKAYETAKGTVRLPLDKPIPHHLIDKLTRYRVGQNTKK